MDEYIPILVAVVRYEVIGDGRKYHIISVGRDARVIASAVGLRAVARHADPARLVRLPIVHEDIDAFIGVALDRNVGRRSENHISAIVRYAGIVVIIVASARLALRTDADQLVMALGQEIHIC